MVPIADHVVELYGVDSDVADIVSNRQLFLKTDWTCITCVVRQPQLQLYGNVARYTEINPGHQVVPVRDSLKWRRLRVHPLSFLA